MTSQEIAQIVTLARRAPLQNMAEAEAAASLLQKLLSHFAKKVVDDENAELQRPDRSDQI